jgi:site-specific recombinase XerD
MAIFRDLQKQQCSIFVFPHPTDGGSWRFHLDRHYDEIKAKAGLSKEHRLHDTRHSYATNLRRNGVNIETIKELMRHASILDTMRYAMYSDDEGRAAIKKLPKWMA